MDDARIASEGTPPGCTSPLPKLLEFRLSLFEDLRDFSSLRATARQVVQDERVDSELRSRANRLLAAAAPARSDLSLARAATADGLALEGARRRATLDRALLAYERAAGQSARVVALRAPGAPSFIDPNALLVRATLEPKDGRRLVWVTLSPASSGAPGLLGRAERVLGEDASIATGAPPGVVVTSGDGRGRVYPSFDAAPLELPPGDAHVALRGGVVVVATRTTVTLHDASTARELLRQSVTLSSQALRQAARSADLRYWVACEAAETEPSGVVVVDAESRTVTVNYATSAGCAFDPETRMLAIAQPPQPGAAQPVLEWSTLGAQPKRALLPKTQEPLHQRLSLDLDVRAVRVASAQKITYVRMESGRQSTRRPANDGASPPRLRNVSVGHAGDSVVSTNPLRALAVPPRKVIAPSFATLASWNENGLISRDGKTVAAFTSSASYEDIKLVIADAATLKVRHRIAVQFGLNWLTAYFLDDRRIVVQSYPVREVYDVQSGEFLAAMEDPEASVVFERFLVEQNAVWDLAPRAQPGDRQLDLGIASSGNWTTQGGTSWAAGKDRPGKVSLGHDGSVRIGDMAPPRFLYCRFGEWLAPWPVCEHRFVER